MKRKKLIIGSLFIKQFYIIPFHVMLITLSINSNTFLFIQFRPSDQRLVIDEQSSPDSTYMFCVRIHRQDCGATTNG